MPEILFNGEKASVAQGESVASLLLSRGLEPASLICVLNGDVVEAKDLPSTRLADGDALDLLKLAGGG